MKEWIIQAAAKPRPDMARKGTVVLDGEWDFALDRLNTGRALGWPERKTWRAQKIRVPFCAEAGLSGADAGRFPAVMWYHTVFDKPADLAPGRRALLTVGAADYRSQVWLNGNLIGQHEGGYTPFTMDATAALRPGENHLVIRVRDSLDPRIPRGKQSVTGAPFSIFYTPVSGIWQSVWLDTVGAAHIAELCVRADLRTGGVSFECSISGEPGAYRIEAEIVGPAGNQFEEARDFTHIGAGAKPAALHAAVPNPRAWSPADPALYRARLALLDAAGRLHDAVETYFGFRTIEIRDGRILLNGERLYQKLLLNQGYFPEGHYTPAQWDDFRADVQQARDMGFNGVRMHQKIENPKFLFWADALGLLVWEEMPSAFLWSGRMRAALRAQWAEAVRRDRSHPCIVAWVPINESWGVNNLIFSQAARGFVKEMADLTRELDPTRPVVDNSGFEHVDPDILDLHHYLGTAETARRYYADLRDPATLEFKTSNVLGRLKVHEQAVSPLAPGVKYNGQPLLVSEYGGFGFYKNTEGKSLLDNFTEYTLDIAREDLFQGFAYTQQYDTELEQNGLLTFDRQPKIPLEHIAAVNKQVDNIVHERWTRTREAARP